MRFIPKSLVPKRFTLLYIKTGRFILMLIFILHPFLKSWKKSLISKNFIFEGRFSLIDIYLTKSKSHQLIRVNIFIDRRAWNYHQIHPSADNQVFYNWRIRRYHEWRFPEWYRSNDQWWRLWGFELIGCITKCFI